MIIRKATREDSKTIASCLLLAMEDIVYKLIGAENFQKAMAFMEHFAEREQNQYSWQNCRVAQTDGKVVGAVNIYDGARLAELRQPVINYVRTRFGSKAMPEDETQSGEFYIDTLGVLPEYRCMGIGSHLIQALIEEFVINHRVPLGLLVGDENSDAKRLYLRLGFKVSGKRTLLGKQLDHLVYAL